MTTPPTPPTNPTPPLISGCKQCGCTNGCSCDCGTDCSTGAVQRSTTPTITPHGDFSHSYSNLLAQGSTADNPQFGMGNNIVVANWAYVTPSTGLDGSSQLAFVWGPGQAVWFNINEDGSYSPLFGSRCVLTAPTISGVVYYRICDPDTGTTYLFDPTTGLLYSTTTGGGQITQNTIATVAGFNRITQSIRSLTYTRCGESLTTTETWQYDYFTSGSHSGLLQYATLSRTDDSTVAIRRLSMTYYQSGDAGGNLGDLQSVSLQTLDGTEWATISTTLYRYYIQNYDGTTNTQPGYQHGLKFVVGPEAYARLARQCDPLIAPDDTTAKFADYYYEFTALVSGTNSRRVTKSVTDGGTLPHLFSYVTTTVSGAPADYFNNWLLQSTATHADGSQQITFSNYVSRAMLTDLWDTPGHQPNGRSINYTQYDLTTGCSKYCYTPASINMSSSRPVYDSTYTNLNVQLYADTGLVNVMTYTSITAGGTTFNGLLATTSVQQGSAGSPTTVTAFTYTASTAGTGPTTTWLILPASSSNYPDGVTAVTTDYSYAYFSGTVQVETKTTTLPQIPSSQNGEGVGGTYPLYKIQETFDIEGRLTDRTDPYNSYPSPPSWVPSVQNVYDEPTGALIQSIRNPYVIGTPPDDVQYNLTTDYAVDFLGRTIQTLMPWFNSNGQQVRTASWTVYRDIEHEVWTASGYATGSVPGEYEYTLINPVSIAKMDFDGRTVENVTAVRLPAVAGILRMPPPSSPGPSLPSSPATWPLAPDPFLSSSGPLSPADFFPQSSYVRWTTTHYDDAGDMTASRVYHAIPACGPGVRGCNYDESRYGVDIMNRQNMTRSPGGTITRTVFDVRDNLVQIYVGTNDAGATDESPDGFSAPGNNMQNTVTNVFDNGNPVGGNSLLTSTIRHIDFTTVNDRLTTFGYDFRNRRTTTTEYFNPTFAYCTITVNTLDNLGRVTQTQQYNTSVAGANLIRQRNAFIDWLGRTYQTQVWGVSGGTLSTYPLTGNTWFNAMNQPVKQISSGGSQSYTKTAYDLVNRLIATYAGYAVSTDTNPWGISSSIDKIFEQTLLTLDAVGNVLQTTSFQLNQGVSGATGVLTTGNARVSYSGTWFDGIGRTIAVANFGTNSFDPAEILSPPASSPTVLVSQTLYNARGEAYLTIDPAGRVTRTDADDLGRTILSTDNYVPPGPCSSCGATGPCCCALRSPWPQAPSPYVGNDQNVMVATTHTPDGYVASLTALNPVTGPQTTRYLYGTTLDAGVVGGNAIARSDLLTAVIYSDATDSTDSVQFAYNLQGQVNWMQDQNGTVHQYSFDGFGRRLRDNILEFGANVDQSTETYSYAYEPRGMLSEVYGYGYSGGSWITSEVYLEYDAFEQLLTDYQYLFQSLSGTGFEQTVDYAYATPTATSNTIRRVSITYPYSASGSRVVGFNYSGSGDGDDNNLGRVSSLSFTGETVASWNYFGLASVAETEYAVAINSTVASGSSYPGLDLFGRIINLPWTQSSTGDLAQLQYGYDQASNRTYRRDAKAGSNFDELYSYDGLRRLTAAARGTLASGDASITSPTLQQGWQLDATGNWTGFNNFDVVTAANTLVQQRASNAANEITGIAATVGSAWQTPAYDRNGNMVTISQPLALASGYKGVWDAWNRLIYLQSADGSENVEFCIYDGLNRRIMRNTYSSGGSLTESRFFVYSSLWQVLEEYVAATSLTTPVVQWVWGVRYIDDCVLRDRSNGGTLNERLYALQDANWNVVALYNPSTSAIVERYSYTPYGVVQFLSSSFVQVSGNVSAYAWESLYCGYRYDSTVGLYLARFRWLNPPLGAWLSKDPLGFRSGWNPYRYLRNSPTIFTDPVGLRGPDLEPPPPPPVITDIPAEEEGTGFLEGLLEGFGDVVGEAVGGIALVFSPPFVGTAGGPGDELPPLPKPKPKPGPAGTGTGTGTDTGKCREPLKCAALECITSGTKCLQGSCQPGLGCSCVAYYDQAGKLARCECQKR